ncbi:hypothetical protein HOP61_17960 [Halomonas daqingensis]|uniref:Uncharacterized protein n=1 Tax=Billgrantia desiderata TaxID=52021 RepID=A0AAW4YXM7_9GAMM|nr:hypothetical protein [Halomonas desiderata]MCE8053180.1 hypothetical protein [Halomonas desiderata]
MNRSAANEIIFGYEVAVNHLEHCQGLFEAIVRLIATGGAGDLTTALTLARLGIDQTDLAQSEVRVAGMDAERMLEAAVQKVAMTRNDRANSIAERVLEGEPA